MLRGMKKKGIFEGLVLVLFQFNALLFFLIEFDCVYIFASLISW